MTRNTLAALLLIFPWGLLAQSSPSTDEAHAMCVASGRIADLEFFYNNYSVPDTCAYRMQDMYVIDAYYNLQQNLISDDEFIRIAAPYRIAYEVLISHLQSHIQQQQWEQALTYAKQFAPAFGEDHCFQDLLRVLSQAQDTHAARNNFGDSINSSLGMEYAMVMSADEKTLFFTGRDRRDNLGGEDIFVSYLKDSVWSKAQRLDEINTIFGNESAEGLSLDGTQLIVFQDGETLVTTLTAKGWSEPKPFMDSIHLSDWMSDAMITADGKALLFAASTQGEHELTKADDLYDATNIYVATKDSLGHWSNPISLGPTINTAASDRAPFLHPDMRTLYFCSAGHSTLGGLDVFKSTRLDDNSWTEWSQPVNLGTVINSAGTECWYRISTDGSKAFFSHTDNGDQNLYWMYLPQDMKPQPVVTISGHLIGPHGTPISGTIRWEDLDTHQSLGTSQSRPDDGYFFIALPTGKNYGYFVHDSAYFPVANNIDLTHVNEPIQIGNDIVVATIQQMVDEDISMPLNNLFFNTNEAILLPASITELDRAIAILRQYHIRVSIEGHTDAVGTDESNQTLSESRAQAVRNYFIEHGIAPERLSTIGYGETRPRDTNLTEEGRQHNRRVELRFIK